MDFKDFQYFAEGLSTTLGELYGDVYHTLIVKGKKRMGQDTKEDSPEISELIKRTREQRSIQELLSTGKQGQDALIASIGAEVRKILSSAGVVTRTDLARIERRMDEIEKALEQKEKQ